jgi:four helix bundle protein
MSFRFRKFKVYDDAQDWLKIIFQLTLGLKRAKMFELSNQIDRAGISVILNIAEGSDRGSDRELNRFLDISLGSLNEVIAGLDIARRSKFISDAEFDGALVESEKLAKQLGGFKRYLKSC